MDDDYRVARRYLAPIAESFWSWSSDGTAVEWTDSGRTIAFTAEIKHVLDRLAPDGLPPLDAVILLLAACRENWADSSKGFIQACHALVNAENILLPHWFRLTMAGLDHVNELHADLRDAASSRGTLEAKAELAQVVFEGTTARTLQTTAAFILQRLEGRPDTELLAPRDAPVSSDWLSTKLGCLQPGLSRVDAEALRLRLRTGLEQIVEPAEPELWPAERMRLLLGQLAADDELGGIARLARDLMAAIHLPRPLADPDDLPAGGISDISNRGNLDRLLISELANDDLTLAVRVATNEALYLRRETPPKQPPRRRAILIDCGIRMWGVPRVFATAVAMALTAKSDPGGEVDVFRATSDGLEAVDLTTRSGIVEQLAALSPDPQPGPACRDFLERAAEAGTPADAVVVTTDDVLADQDFRDALTKCDASSYFVAAVRRNGQFRLSMRTPAGPKLVCEAALELGDVLAPAKHDVQPLIDSRLDRALPLILGVDPFPLLLSHPLDAERAWHVAENGVFAITKDRRLMHWLSKSQGARQIASDMPGGKILWGGPSPLGGSACALMGMEGSIVLQAVEVDLRTMETRVSNLKLAHPLRAVAVHNGVPLAIYENHVESFTLKGETDSRKRMIPKRTTWVHDRYFRGPAGWYALSSDGLNPHLELVVRPSDFGSRTPITLFDVSGAEGPYGITEKGEILSTLDRKLTPCLHGLNPEIRVLGVSRNGRRVLLSGEPSSQAHGYLSRMLVYTLNGRARPAYGETREALESDIYDVAEVRTLRRRFQSVYADSGSIVLVSRKLQHLRFSCEGPDELLHLSVAEPRDRDAIPFENMPRLANAGYHLRVATWPDGSQAFLDSRGLLHLKSAAANLPDVTLVLYEGATAAWTSDGLLAGSEYFIGDTSNADSRAIRDVLLEFVKILP